ncbi:putative toxin-antitoxin system toxin component, PIN family, partial [Candidatus Curtissbacteria bacterium RIFCSPLOWO2_01_FULL_37_9]
TFQKPYFQKRLSSKATTNFIDLLQNEAFVTPIIVKVQNVATHPEDDLTIATALSAKADYLVTGDQSLLNKVGNSYKGVILTTPSDFLKILQ